MDELPTNLPAHVAIIMDGNGRWAEARDLPRTEGHSRGARSARTVAESCVEFGIPYLTLYAFSTENWQRPDKEVRFLMRRLRQFLIERRDEMIEQGIRLQAIGRTEDLPMMVRRELRKTLSATEGGDKLTLNLAVNYGARSEIVDACRSLAARVAGGELTPEQIDEDLLSDSLYTAGQPDPDLLIRTGGEMRLSNFLLWQLSYAEIHVTDILWPDFGREEFVRTLHEFARRERRYGGV